MKLFFVLFGLCIFTLSGCTQRLEEVPNIIVAPSTLDFGRVRVADSPVSLSFDIENTGKEPLSILDITSGCGCTVIDIPQEPIQPKEKKSVAAKVNLYGRSGEFTNMVHIKTDRQDDLFIDIKGTIVTDIWLSGQSIRCSAEPGKPEAKTTFSLFTRDYPDVQFDWSSLPPEIKIQEISRSVSEGIYNIRFDLSVFIGEENALSHQLIITPKEKGVAPLFVPIYCYRNEEYLQQTSFSTKQINLGVIARNETKLIQIYGNPDVIHVIREITWKDVPDGITAEIIPQDTVPNDVLNISLKFAETFPNGIFEGAICLITLGGREFTIPINGEIEESR